MKVLVVEDKELLRGHMVELLCESDGVSLVATAKDIAGAMAASRRVAPDLALTRFKLPDGNALDFLRASRESLERPFETVVLDDDPNPAHAKQCAAAGARAYFTLEQADQAVTALLAAYPHQHDTQPGGPILHPIDEPGRLAALQALEILESPRDEVLDNIARMAASACGTPFAMISVVDAERAWMKAVAGLKVSDLPRNLTLCQHVVVNSAAVVVRDIALDPRFRGNPLAHAKPAFAAYAGVPLRTRDGHTLGALCAIDSVPRAFDDRQVEALERLAEVVMARFDGRAQLRMLARETAELERRIRIHERAERRARIALDSVDGLAWECDANTLGCVAVSAGLERLFDLERRAWLERPSAWLEMVTADDRPRVQASFEAARHAWSAQPLAFSMDNSHGRRIFLRGEVHTVDDGDGRKRLQAVTIDVTEAREAAAYIADLLARYERALKSGAAAD